MTCCGPQQLRLHTTNALQFLQSHFTTSPFFYSFLFLLHLCWLLRKYKLSRKMSLIFSPYNFWVSRFLKSSLMLENSSANQSYPQAGLKPTTPYTIELTDGADTSLKWHVSWIIYTFYFLNFEFWIKQTNQTVGDWI